MSPFARHGDCLGRAWDGLKTCVAERSPASVCYGGTGYDWVAGMCGYPVAAAPAPQPFGFPTLQVGRREQWLPTFRNTRFPGRATLHASWTPLHTSRPDYVSGPEIGPFRLAYGQVFKLIPNERQKFLLEFVPTQPGNWEARLYVWWVYGNKVEWEGVWDFRGSAVPPPPPPPPPCTDKCWAAFRSCSATNQTTRCQTEYKSCAHSCRIGFPLPESGGQELSFGSIPVGQARQSGPLQYKNKFGSAPFYSTATLYASWTPYHSSDPGAHSPPDLGPYRIVTPQRQEIKGGKRGSVVVEFRPTQTGTYDARLYIWWDHEGSTPFYAGVFDLRGYGVTSASPAAGATPGARGGAESLPPWLFAKNVPPLWKGLTRLGRGGSLAATSSKRRTITPRGPEIVLRDLVPPTVMGVAPTFREPEAVIIGGNNAIESIAADYLDGDGVVRAAVLALRTRGDPYAHVYPVCSRVKGTWIEDARYAGVAMPDSSAPATFWETTSSARDDGDELRKEIATGFIAYISPDRGRAVIDSRWLWDEYAPHSSANGEVLTFQVWSADAATTAELRDAVLSRLRARTRLEYRNTNDAASPDIFIAAATYDGGEAVLHVINDSTAGKNVTLTAVTWTAANSQSQAVESFQRVVPPGTSKIALPLPGRLNGVVYMSEANTTWRDMIYFADGYWFSYGEGAPPQWTAPDCPAVTWTSDDVPAAGCAQLTTSIPRNGWRGIGRAMTTYTRNGIVVEPTAALTFFTRGSESTSEVRIVTEAAEGIRLTYGTIFTPSASGRQITIPLQSFIGRDSARGRRIGEGERIVEVLWNTAGAPHESSSLLVGNVAFSEGLMVDAAPTAPTLAASTEPVVVTARLAGSEGIAATLSWRRVGEASFTRVQMTLDPELDITSAAIPVQPSGSLVEWYVEATDSTGRTVTSPHDAPYMTNTFTVGPQPQILVDDFEDARAANRQNDFDWSFAGDGGGLDAEHAHGALRLRYDVASPGAYAGWVAPFATAADVSSYDALLLRVRGDPALFRIGIADADRMEQKVVLAKFVTGGVAGEWRDVHVPMSVFTLIDQTRVEKVVIAFENRLDAAIGSVELDDLRFVATGAPLTLPVASFDDRAAETASGGQYLVATGGTAVADGIHSSGAYRISARGNATSWVTAVFDLQSADLRELTLLRFRIRSAPAVVPPHVYVVTGPPLAEVRTWVDLASYATLSADWSEITIPLKDFADRGADLSFVRRIDFAWESRDFSETVDLDDIQLQR